MKQDKYINNKEKINYKRMPSIKDMNYMIFYIKLLKCKIMQSVVEQQC